MLLPHELLESYICLIDKTLLFPLKAMIKNKNNKNMTMLFSNERPLSTLPFGRSLLVYNTYK